MALAITRTDVQVGSANGNNIKAVFSGLLSGNYTTGGETVDFTQVAATLFGTSQPPRRVPSVIFAGFAFEFIIGTSLANTKMKIWLLTTGLELAAGAYPAGLTAGSFPFEAEFQKF